MAQSEPLVTVIVPHHLNQNDEYLHWCVKSVLASEGVALEVIVISDAEQAGDIPEVTYVHNPDLNNVTKKWHYGVKMANPSSKYVMLISDDVMVSKYTIADLAQAIGDNQMILGPASNCDATTRFYAQFYATEHKPMTLKMTMADLHPDQQAVIDFPKMNPILIDPGWVSFYCTMFPKTVLTAVGDFDEALDCRHNDVDYCQRARRLGIPALIHLGVYALHFGDKTLPLTTSQSDYAAADEAYRQKNAAQLAL